MVGAAGLYAACDAETRQLVDYTVAGGSRSLRALWTLGEIGVTVNVRSLGVRPRLQEPEYLAINPAGTLPALIDGDRAIYESLAICEYAAIACLKGAARNTARCTHSR